MNKRLICIILALVVTCCALFSVIAAAIIWKAEGQLSSGHVLLVLLTLFSSVVIWRGISEMK